MTSFTKIIFRLLPLGIVLLIAVVYNSLNDYKYIEAEESIVKPQVSRHRRAINPKTVLRYCKFNQYYDQEEGRCLGVPGGGKVLHVENGRSCGINILKPHCTSSLYYYICKRDKSILAQCANRQIFDNRLQRCAYYDSSKLTPSTIQPNDHEYYEHVNVSKFPVPNCTALGQFPVPDHCFMFYTCDTNGHRLHQSVFKCPRNTGYQPNRRVCAVMSDCENNDSIDSVCVLDALDENVELLNSKETTEENVKEISEESEIRNVNDSASKREENINFRTYDDIISTTPESITGNTLSVNNYGDNDGDLYEASSLPTQPIQDISVSDSETSTLKQALTPTESAREVQNEKSDLISPLYLQITSPPTVEFDDNEPHSIITPMTSTPVYSTDMKNSNIDSETIDITPFSTVSYTSKLYERMQDITTEQYNNYETMTLPNSNTETLGLYSPSTISNTPEFSSINDKSLNVDEKKRDVTGAIDLYQTSTISNVPEPSLIVDTPSKLGEKTQDTTTEEYRNNDDAIMTLPNSNTETLGLYSSSTISNTPEFSSINDKSLNVDEEKRDVTGAIDLYQTSTISNVPEPSLIDDTPSKLGEETQDTTTEEYRNNDDAIMTLPNSNTETLGLYSPSTISNTPEFSSINDKSLNVDEEKRDVTGAIDLYQTSTISNVPEPSLIDDTPSKLGEETQDTTTEEYRNNDDAIMTLPNSNTETLGLYSPSTISNTPEFSSINDKSLNVDEEKRDVTGAIDLYQTSTISNVPEPSLIVDTPSKLGEKTQDITTEEYRNNDDAIMTLPNSNTEAINLYPTSTINTVPEFSPISETSSKLYETMQNAATEQYGNDDGIMTSPNSNSEIVDQNPTSILSGIFATTESPRDDFDTSTSASAILSPQADINDDQYAKELFKTSPSVDSKLIDPDLDTPEAVENVSTGYSFEHTDTLDLASTTKSTLTLEHITASMDITTITPIIQNLSAISDTDLVTQNDKDSTEASPFIEQDIPLKNN